MEHYILIQLMVIHGLIKIENFYLKIVSVIVFIDKEKKDAE